MRTASLLLSCGLTAALLPLSAPTPVRAQPPHERAAAPGSIEVSGSLTITFEAPPAPRDALTPSPALPVYETPAPPAFAPLPTPAAQLPPAPSALVLPGFAPPGFHPAARPSWGQPVLVADEGPRQRTRWELIAPGIAALGLGYLGWFATAIGWNGANNTCSNFHCTFNGRGPDGGDIGRSLIPIAGPWLSVAQSETMRGADFIVPVAAGVGQLAGVVMIVVGLATPQTVGEPSDDASRERVSVDVRASPDAAVLNVRVPFQ